VTWASGSPKRWWKGQVADEGVTLEPPGPGMVRGPYYTSRAQRRYSTRATRTRREPTLAVPAGVSTDHKRRAP